MYDAGYEAYEIACVLHFKIESVQECIDLYYIKVCDSYLKKWHVMRLRSKWSKPHSFFRGNYNASNEETLLGGYTYVYKG